MNIEQLNSCFDAISPTKEQKEKIFAGIMSAKQQPVKVIKFHRYATAAAAVIVIGAFAAVYSNMETNDIVNEGNKNIIAVKNTENTTETEEFVKTTEILPETNNVKAEDKSLADMISEEYPEIMEEVTEDVKVAVQDEAGSIMNKEAYTDTLAEDAPMVVSDSTDEIVAPASGGGGGTAAYRVAEFESITLEQIMSDMVYANFFPTVFADGFEFVSAKKTDYDLNAVFNDNQGRYMSVSVVKDGYSLYEDVVELEDIVNLKSKYGFFNFAIKCGEYYVVYNVESNDALQVYEMVKSSAYFTN